MAKADWSCDECGEILPADHFVQVTDREVARTSGSTRVYRGTRGGVGFGGSSSTSYRHVKKKLCPDCVAYRVELARQARARQRTLWLVGTAAAVLLVIFMANQPPSARAPAALATVAIDNGQVIGAVDPMPDSAPSDEPSPAADASPVSADTADEQRDNAAVPLPASEEPAPPQRMSGNGDAEMTAAIEDATLGALDRGETATWIGGDRHGYILVSEPRQHGRAVCRNAYWTIISVSNQIQGPPVEWCKTNDGPWVKQHR